MGLLNKVKFDECIKNKEALADMVTHLRDLSYNMGETKWMK
jgi:hypothetical protein